MAKTNCMITKYLIKNYDIEIPDEYYTEFLLSKITQAYIHNQLIRNQIYIKTARVEQEKKSENFPRKQKLFSIQTRTITMFASHIQTKLLIPNNMLQNINYHYCRF